MEMGVRVTAARRHRIRERGGHDMVTFYIVIYAGDMHIRSVMVAGHRTNLVRHSGVIE